VRFSGAVDLTADGYPMDQVDLVVVASFVSVSVLGDGEYASDADFLDAEFLFQLTPQSESSGLAWLDVAARKEIPSLACRLRQQYPRALGDDSAHDQLDLREGHFRTVCRRVDARCRLEVAVGLDGPDQTSGRRECPTGLVASRPRKAELCAVVRDGWRVVGMNPSQRGGSSAMVGHSRREAALALLQLAGRLALGPAPVSTALAVGSVPATAADQHVGTS
jgi:hypothetical protein